MNISHHGFPVKEDEELTPTLENFFVLTWLRLIHNDLPRLVKQRYGTELRSRTLASIKSEISQALSSLLEEIRNSDDAKAMRTAISNFPKNKVSSKFSSNKQRFNLQKSCPLCKAAGSTDNHYLSKCTFLPEQDKRYMARTRQVIGIIDSEVDPELFDSEQEDDITSHSSINRVQIRQSPYIDAFFKHHPVRITIDSGATGNMMRASTARHLGVKVSKSSQSAHQADPLVISGETHVTFSRNDVEMFFEGLIVEDLDTDILAGIPFMERNDIAIRPAKHEISLGNKSTVIYCSSSNPLDHHLIRRTRVLRAPQQKTTIWPGEFLELDLPKDISWDEKTFAIEPHVDGNKT